MTSIYRNGWRSISEADGSAIIGGCNVSSFSSPFRLFLTSTSLEDIGQVVIVGIDGEGNRASEFLQLRGQERIFSRQSFLHVDRISVRKGSTNAGSISISAENGITVGTIEPGRCQLNKAEYHAGNQELSVVEYGLSARANSPTEPICAELVIYREQARIVLHRMYVDTKGGSLEKRFQGLILEAGDRIAVEALTGGTEVQVSAWVALEG